MLINLPLDYVKVMPFLSMPNPFNAVPFFLPSFNRWLFGACYVPGTALSTRDNIEQHKDDPDLWNLGFVRPVASLRVDHLCIT